MVSNLCEDTHVEALVGHEFILDTNKSLIRRKSWLDISKSLRGCGHTPALSILSRP